MTTRDFTASGLDGDPHRFSSLGENLVYLYMRLYADEKGVFRLSMTEFAAQLNVTRQSILRHVASLLEKKLITRDDRARYKVHADPWSIEKVARTYLQGLAAGDEYDGAEVYRRAYDRVPNFSIDSDPAWNAVLDLAQQLETAGLIEVNTHTDRWERTAQPLRSWPD